MSTEEERVFSSEGPGEGISEDIGREHTVLGEAEKKQKCCIISADGAGP